MRTPVTVRRVGFALPRALGAVGRHQHEFARQRGYGGGVAHLARKGRPCRVSYNARETGGRLEHPTWGAQRRKRPRPTARTTAASLARQNGRLQTCQVSGW